MHHFVIALDLDSKVEDCVFALKTAEDEVSAVKKQIVDVSSESAHLIADIKNNHERLFRE